MKTFVIYFSIFGKKMKTTIKAETEAEARILIREKIVFHKIEIDRGKDFIDFFNNICNENNT